MFDISGKIPFKNGCSLEFLEVGDIEQAGKVKYRYHYMDEARIVLFRYDNAPHHVEIDSFPHHKHNPDTVNANWEPELRQILNEISRRARH